MDEKEKNVNEEHVKIYDKEMYTSTEKLKTIALIIIVFLIGFIAGYFSRDIVPMSPNDSTHISQSK